jgi:hypothetical protein
VVLAALEAAVTEQRLQTKLGHLVVMELQIVEAVVAVVVITLHRVFLAAQAALALSLSAT